ncbi:hypothetical protein Rhopal_002928-T1 [Rhodotorula paludigena]|uniref:Uncharacterized protein n=1 Tax=Rhodotorula paludigena TaxID=86838 RepID=A0AAV5GJ78_9BASI|nr:hypothetical protein Rhopal_002928-T1 [Rhodotorula paludigena]
MAPSSKGPLLIRALPATLTVPAALKDATLAELRVPLAPDLASIDLPDALLSRLKTEGLPLPTPHKTKKELNNLKQSLLEWGHNAAISPPILAPTPPDLLDPDAAAAQVDALARLANLGGTAPSPVLLRDLKLIVLSGRARWRILEELTEELNARARARGKKSGGKELDESEKAEAIRDEALVTEVCIVLLRSSVFSSPLLLSHIFTTSNLVHSLAAAKFEPTLVYLITSYASARNNGIDAMLPDVGSLTTDMFRALRSRLVTNMAYEIFGTPSGPLASLSYLSPSGLGRIFGSKYPHATPIFLFGFHSTMRFFDLIDIDFSVISLVLFSALSHNHRLVNPLALPPAHDFALDDAHDFVRERGEELALALRDIMAPWESKTSEGAWAWTSIKQSVGGRAYKRNSAGEPHLPESIKLTRTDYVALANGLERMIKVLQVGGWVDDVAAEDLGIVEPFILLEQIESLKPPRPPAAASLHRHEELGDYFGGEVACWIEFVMTPLIDFLFDLANAVRPRGILEARFQKASLEDALLALYDPVAAECRVYQRVGWKKTGPWSLSTELVELARQLYTYLWSHRYRLGAALLLVDSPDPFGAISALAPDSSSPDRASSSPTIWRTKPWQGVLDILEASSERPPTFDVVEALKAIDPDASVDEAKVQTLASASERMCARGRAPARARKALEELAEELLRPPPSPSPPPRTPTPDPPSPSPFPPTPPGLSPLALPTLQPAARTTPESATAGSPGRPGASPRTPSRRPPGLFRKPSAQQEEINVGTGRLNAQKEQEQQDERDDPSKDQPDGREHDDEVDRTATSTSSPPLGAKLTSSTAPSSSSQPASSSSLFNRGSHPSSPATSSSPALGNITNSKRPFRRTTSSSSSSSANALAPSLKRIRPSAMTLEQSAAPLGTDVRAARLTSPAFEGDDGLHLDDSSDSEDPGADDEYMPDKEMQDSDDEDDEEEREESVASDQEEEEGKEEETFGPDLRDTFEQLDHSILCHARKRAMAGWRARSTIADLLLLQLGDFLRRPDLPLFPPDPSEADASSSALPSLAPLACTAHELEVLGRFIPARRRAVARFFHASRPLDLDDYVKFRHPIRPDLAEPFLLELNMMLWDISQADKNGDLDVLEWQTGIERLGRELQARGGRPGCVSSAWPATSATAMAVEGWDGEVSERGKKRMARRAKDEKKRRE